MPYYDALLGLVKAHPLKAMTIIFLAAVITILAAERAYKKRYARAHEDPAAKAVLRHIRYYAQKADPAVLKITAPDKNACKAFRIGDVTKFTPQHLLQSAAEQAWRNEACRAWLLGCRPEFEKEYKNMRHPERKICRDYMRQVLHKMPSGVLVMVDYKKPNGKTSRPGSRRISVDEMTEWLQDSAPGIEPVNLLKAMRVHDFRCSRCGAGIDECLTLVAYRDENNKCVPRCPSCVFED